MIHALMIHALMIHALMIHALMIHALMIHALMIHASIIHASIIHASIIHALLYSRLNNSHPLFYSQSIKIIHFLFFNFLIFFLPNSYHPQRVARPRVNMAQKKKQAVCINS
jgi:hypothetical protein